MNKEGQGAKLLKDLKEKQNNQFKIILYLKSNKFSHFFKKEDFHQTLGVGMNMGLSIKY